LPATRAIVTRRSPVRHESPSHPREKEPPAPVVARSLQHLLYRASDSGHMPAIVRCANSSCDAASGRALVRIRLDCSMARAAGCRLGSCGARSASAQNDASKGPRTKHRTRDPGSIRQPGSPSSRPPISADLRSTVAHRTCAPNITKRPSRDAPYRHICARGPRHIDRRFCTRSCRLPRPSVRLVGEHGKPGTGITCACDDLRRRFCRLGGDSVWRRRNAE